jgi:hypothetical protein
MSIATTNGREPELSGVMQADYADAYIQFPIGNDWGALCIGVFTPAEAETALMNFGRFHFGDKARWDSGQLIVEGDAHHIVRGFLRAHGAPKR